MIVLENYLHAVTVYTIVAARIEQPIRKQVIEVRDNILRSD